MKKPTEITKYTEQDIITPPVEYLEKLHQMNPIYVDDFFASSRSRQEHLQTIELKRLDSEHQHRMAPFEHKNLAVKFDFREKILGLFSGLTALLATLAFIAYLVSINRADIAGFSVLIAAIGILINKFLKR